MRGLLICVLFGARILSISGYSSAKEGRCPTSKGNINCDVKHPQCFMDIDCVGTNKCCNDGCGGYTCKSAIIPPRPVQEECTVDAAVQQRNQLNPNCETNKTKFCSKTNCASCCEVFSTCNPNPSLYTSVAECTKVLCAKKHCYTQGEICVMGKYNKAQCVCPKKCPPTTVDEPVCGTDKITYQSRCQMNITACVLGDIIAVAYPGECRREQNTVTVSPSHVNNQVLKAGKRGKITCQFEGDPVQIIWDKSGLERLPSNRMLPQDNVLVIKRVVKSDAGVYLCSGFDGVRAVVASVNVTVKEPKKIALKAIKPKSVCLQDKLIGTGTRYVVRFYFNSATRLCQPFVYSGDGGNKNNFPNQESCIKACSHSAYDICHLPKMPGPCMARFPKWFYDTRSAKCKMFVFGGCLGNANNFDSKIACLKECSAKHICILPKALGTCTGHTARYYFDPASNSCKKFFYSGCDGNANRFHSRKRCERKCKKKPTAFSVNLRVKPGVCMAPIFDVSSCSDHSRDSCMSDMDCQGRAKCCFDGCHRTCSEPLERARISGRRAKLGQCPAPKFPKEVCANRYESDVCQADHECPGMHKCCHNGCYYDCVLPKKMPNGRPKPGICPAVQNGQHVLACKSTRHECSKDNDCFGRQKCCNNGCHRECMDVQPYKPKPGQCPIQDEIEAEDCSDTRDDCSFDNQCPGTSKCCFTGCKMECSSPPGIKPGLCPKPWKGLAGFCDLRGDICAGDSDCQGDAKCCHNGCQKDCVSPKDKIKKDKKPSGKCPKPWKDVTRCDRMGDRCDTDKDCYGNFKCCFNGCQKDCVQPVNLTRCQIEKQSAMDQLADELPPLGIFVPSCTKDGSFHKIQCHGSVGQCWCVDETGTEINGTRTRGTPNCVAKVAVAREGTCPKAWKGSRGFCDFRGDACDKDKDCPFTQKCCNNGCQRDCVYPDGMSPCRKHRQSTAGLLMVGQFTPKCRPDGFYDSIQCHGSTGHCWCVDIYGNELPHTRMTRGRPNCNNPVGGTGLGVPGRCPDPTKGNNGICDRMGDECTIDSTCSGPNQKCCFNGCQRQCLEAIPLPTEAVLTLCQKKLKAASRGPFGVPLLGAFVPSCKSDGSFKETQCHGSVGDCWCVHTKTGEEIVSTRISVRRGQRPPDCSDAGLTKCQRHYRDSLDMPPIGRFQPSCEDSGKYESMQCHGSTGHCWCVDEEGTELTETRIRGRPDCRPKLDPCAGVRCPYYGRCVASKEGSTSCQCSKFCTFEYMPLCGSDGKTYGNECEMKSTICESKKMITIASRGECPEADNQSCTPRMKCSHPLQSCFMKNSQPVCECPLMKCTSDRRLVCGTDNQTYDNKCMMHMYACKHDLDIKVAHDGQCKDVLSDPCSVSLCSHPQHTCQNINNTAVCKCRMFTTLEYNPKCASDGKTYPNTMSMENAGCEKNMILKVVKDGKCDTIEKLGACPAPWDVSGPCETRANMCEDDGSCNGTTKCCYDGCHRVCVNAADELTCNEDCGRNKQCVGFTDGTTRCLCKKGSLLEGNTCKRPDQVAPPPQIDLCEINLCSFPHSKCIVVNGTATCECPKACPLNLMPVCGTDGKTYDNMCLLEVEACKPENTDKLQLEHRGQCKNEMPDPCSMSLCSHPQHTCQNINNTAVCKCRMFTTLEYNPKCASDGKTYPNTMSMENAGCEKNMILKVVKDGKCEAVTKAGTCPAPWTGLNGLCNRRGSMCDDDSGCGGAMKCCYNGCQMDCVNVADNIQCEEDCDDNEQCAGFPDGSTRCLCKKDTIMNMDGTCAEINKTIDAKPIDPCEISLCSFPHSKCIVVNGTATCECPKACPLNLMPVCGTDGKTYDNMCLLEVEACKPENTDKLQLEHRGQCKKKAIEDICAKTLCTHPLQKCVHKNDRVTCECPLIICPAIYAPVCGSDGETYPSNCTLAAAGCSKSQNIRVVSQGPCPENINPCSKSLCSHPQHTCQNINNTAVCKCREITTLEYNPKCASDGKTYPNTMSMENAGCEKNMILKVVKDGKCEAVTKAGTCPAPWTGLNGLCSRRGSMCDDDSSCGGTMKCCYNGCQRDCVNVADNLQCDDDCGPNERCVGFHDGSTRCLCEQETVMTMDETCQVALSNVTADPCEISLCAFPTTVCVVVNDTATCECPQSCTREYAPVCGTDGKTYGNLCTLAAAACKPENKDTLNLAHHGACKKGECSSDANCSSNAQCTNTSGSFVCRCNKGFEGNGRVCKDVDECKSEVARCHELADCINIQGSYYCRCRAGYEGDGIDICKDQDICGREQADCHENANCINIRGSYKCRCIAGYVGDGKNCTPASSDVVNPCEASLCAFPTTVCVVVNDTATCECPQACTREYAPVCGTDGKTYGNLCTLAAAACKPENKDTLNLAHHGACSRGGPRPGPPGPKPGKCPPTDPRPCPPIASPVGSCKSDSECPGHNKCCYDGCSSRCMPLFVKPSKPGLCPKPWKGLDGICDRRGDMCAGDSDCRGDEKCCYNGCQKDCVSPKAASSNTTTNPCDISLCAFPTIRCVVVNNTASCECPRACTREYRPVCGSDGKQYPNLCTLASAACKPENKGVLKLSRDIACSPARPSKPGTCPPTDPRPCPPIGRPGSGCKSDSECPGQSKCCHDGCSSRCMPHFVPRGCPIIKNPKPCLQKYDRKAYCQRDSDCPRSQRCCFDGCIKRCDFFRPLPPGSMPGGGHGGAPGGNISPPGVSPPGTRSGESRRHSQG